VEEIVEEFRKFANIERPSKKVVEGFKGLDVSLVYDTLWNRFGIDNILLA
jgi:hypothetical protein